MASDVGVGATDWYWAPEMHTVYDMQIRLLVKSPVVAETDGGTSWYWEAVHCSRGAQV